MRVLNDAINAYMDDYLTAYIDINDLDFSEPDNYIHDKAYHDMLRDDLEDKGFTTEEANAIIVKSLDKETAYKFLCYFFLLYDEYSDEKELRNLILEGYGWDEDDISDADLTNIVKYLPVIDY